METKFRIYDSKRSEYVDPINYLINGRGEIFYKFAGVVNYLGKPSNLIVEFYTGLKDRNGKEIYEGDIVVIFGWYPFFDGGKPNYVGVIEWDDGGFYMVLRCVNEDKRGISDGVGEFFEDSERYDAIGNIHENPELLPGS